MLALRSIMEWRDDVNDDDDMETDPIDSQALTGGDITRYRALVARISYLSQERPDLKFASVRVCCAMANPSMRDMERVKRNGRYLVGKPRAKCWFLWQQSGDLEAHSDADWGGDRATRRSVSAGVIMRGSCCPKVWTKKQQVVALSSAESGLCAAVKTASEGLGIQSVARDLGISCRLNLHLDASATVCLVNRRGLGKAKHVDMQNLWIQEAYKSKRFVTKKVGTSVNPADLMTKPMPRPKIEQLMNIMGFEFVEQCLKRAGNLTKAKEKPRVGRRLEESRSGAGVEGRIWAARQKIALGVLMPLSARW